MKEQHKNGIIYITETKYVDIDTGQVLTKKIATNKYKYIIIKINKDETHYTGTKCTIKYTTECRKQPQLKLF